MSFIQGYRLDAVHAFRVRTLTRLGYDTRVVLANGSDRRPDLATPFRIDVSVIPAGGPPELLATDIAEVKPTARCLIDCAPFTKGRDGEVELVFHLLPQRIQARARDGLVDLSSDELFFYFAAQDHYVEYYRSDGFAAGLLYQGGAFNYELFSRDRSTLIQAPKIYVSNEVDTLASFAHGSADPGYRDPAELRCVLVAEDGRSTAWVEHLPAFSLSLISMRDRARALVGNLGPEARFFSLYATCRTALLLPITIQRNDRTGAIGLEHSLPPLYYADRARGPLRARALQALAASPLFEGLP